MSTNGSALSLEGRGGDARIVDQASLDEQRDAELRRKAREALRAAPDIARALGRLSVARGGPRDLANLRDGVKAVAGIFAFMAFLVGATAAGAEWSAGTMQSLLYWEPRRVRVMVAKVAALAAAVVVRGSGVLRLLSVAHDPELDPSLRDRQAQLKGTLPWVRLWVRTDPR